MHFLNKEVFLFLPRKQQSLAPWELRGGGGTVGRVGTQPAHLFGGLGTRFESKPGGKGPVPTGPAVEQTRKLTGPTTTHAARAMGKAWTLGNQSRANPFRLGTWTRAVQGSDISSGANNPDSSSQDQVFLLDSNQGFPAALSLSMCRFPGIEQKLWKPCP